MIRCRSFKQLIVLLGAAILLPSVIARAQAPRCAGVLSTISITQAQMDKTISELAEMKLAVDLAQSRGQLTLSEKQLARNFVTKLVEFRDNVQSQLSPKEIQNLLAQKIYELQKTENSKRTEEVESRTEQKKAITFYDLKKRLNVKFDPQDFRDLTFIPETDFLAYREGHNLTLLNTESESPEVIAQNIKQFSAQKGSLITLSNKDEIGHYDIMKKQMTTSKLKIAGEIAVFSPNGEWVASVQSKTIQFTNTTTGKVSPFKFTELEPASKLNIFARTKKFSNLTMKSYRFISDNEIIVLARSNTVFKFNFMTGHSEEIFTGDFIAEAVIKAGDNLFFAGRDSLASLPYSKSTDFVGNAIYLKTNVLHFFNLEAINNKIVFIRFQVNNATEPVQSTFLDSSTLLPLQAENLESLFSDSAPLSRLSRVSAPAQDTQGNRFFFGVSVLNPRTSWIDIWEKTTVDPTGEGHD